MVYGTKQFYVCVRTGNLGEIMADLTKDYGENRECDAQLNHESKLHNKYD